MVYVPESVPADPASAARMYTEAGLGGVLQLRGKRPVRPGGRGHIGATTTDPTEAARMFASGVYAVGLVPAPGVLALDIDVKHDAGGEDTVAEWEAEAGPLPAAPTVRTPSGGRHIYVQWDGPLPRKGRGVDFIAHGHGLVVVPPGGGYAWEAAGEVPELPESWAQLLTARAAKAQPSRRRRGGVRAVETPAERAEWDQAQEAAAEAARAWYRARGLDA